jgi:hypothetical protein
VTRAAVAVVALLVAAGCGGGDDGDGGGTTGTTTRPTATSTTPAPPGEPSAEQRERPTEPPSGRDRDVQRDVKRHLDQVAVTRSRGEWAAADIGSVTVRGQRVEIATKLRGDRAREQATSICLAARQGLIAPGEVSTPYDLFVSAAGMTVAAC